MKLIHILALTLVLTGISIAVDPVLCEGCGHRTGHLIGETEEECGQYNKKDPTSVACTYLRQKKIQQCSRTECGQVFHMNIPIKKNGGTPLLFRQCKHQWSQPASRPTATTRSTHMYNFMPGAPRSG
ncbi:hypothetical protein PGT21_022995 [Puccinia graminis f. sp. tritici]|uniref:Secreted protein n=1 Tax=Puccinia graminis f. sp. tritici TaxID=56615 RepID=A0A5B0M425_PUCGR|nr:hypothetical protein PGT21_022995 [Puccinia graminis f. sp. tritici]